MCGTQPPIVGKYRRGLLGLLRVESGMEPPERVDGFVGPAVGGGDGARVDQCSPSSRIAARDGSGALRGPRRRIRLRLVENADDRRRPVPLARDLADARDRLSALPSSTG